MSQVDLIMSLYWPKQRNAGHKGDTVISPKPVPRRKAEKQRVKLRRQAPPRTAPPSMPNSQRVNLPWFLSWAASGWGRSIYTYPAAASTPRSSITGAPQTLRRKCHRVGKEWLVSSLLSKWGQSTLVRLIPELRKALLLEVGSETWSQEGCLATDLGLGDRGGIRSQKELPASQDEVHTSSLGPQPFPPASHGSSPATHLSWLWINILLCLYFAVHFFFLLRIRPRALHPQPCPADY